MRYTSDPAQPVLILPIGTQVVTRVPAQAGAISYPAGAVGVVIGLPEGTEQRYRIRLPDGNEVLLARQDLTIRKAVARAGLQTASPGATNTELEACVILRCVVGSRAYGLDRPGSDTDRRGIYLPPADLACHDVISFPAGIVTHRVPYRRGKETKLEGISQHA